MGTVRHESVGKILFYDETNDLECTIKFNSAKKKYFII